MRFLAALLLTPALAGAAGAWERFELPERAGYWEIDRASVTPTKQGTKRVLTRTTLTGMKSTGGGTTSAFYDQSVTIMEADCENRRARVVEGVAFLRAERIEAGDTSTPWQPMPANSTLYVVACGK